MNKTYIELLKAAEQAQSRQEALALIHAADKLRMQLKENRS